MTRDEAFNRLGRLQGALTELHNERAVAWQGWHIAKYRCIQDFLQRGMSVSSAKENADAAVVELRNRLVALEGEIAALEEERDHLRFLIDQGGV